MFLNVLKSLLKFCFWSQHLVWGLLRTGSGPELDLNRVCGATGGAHSQHLVPSGPHGGTAQVPQNLLSGSTCSSLTAGPRASDQVQVRTRHAGLRGPGEPPGVQPDSHLRGGRVRFQGAVLLKRQSSSRLSIVSRAGDNGPARLGLARLGPAGCSSSRLLGSGSGPGSSSWAPGRQQPRRRHSAGCQARFRPGSGPVHARFRLGSVSARRCCSSSFSRQKGRGCRKEGGKEEHARGMLGSVVRGRQESRFKRGFKDSTSQHASVKRGVIMALGVWQNSLTHTRTKCVPRVFYIA